VIITLWGRNQLYRFCHCRKVVVTVLISAVGQAGSQRKMHTSF